MNDYDAWEQPIRILLVEDMPTDAELSEREVRKVLPAAVFRLVETEEAFLEALEQFQPGLIISDYYMPRFDGMTALTLARERVPETPVIILTGSMNEDTAVACMKAGAADYVIKEHTKRLGPAVINALEQRQVRGEKKRAQAALLESEEKYRGIFENAAEGIYQSTPGGRFFTVNPAFSRMLGYDSPAAMIDEVVSIADQVYVEPGERRMLMEELNDKGFFQGHEMQFYRKNGEKIWVSANGHIVRNEDGSIAYYEGLIEDITQRKEVEEERRQSIDKLHRAVGAIIQTVAMTVEVRDPYTSGHQQRVACLARAMGQALGLSADRVEGLRLAAMIHDLGKVSVPAEILSKPTRLTAVEFALIKTHAQTGFNILKDIEFPWPIAEIVYQHHERMNGSGYPRGQQGDELLPEARILAVADVVEAMSTHRPYRPALGIEAALAEIRTNRALLYDPDAVDVCLRLFAEGYELG